MNQKQKQTTNYLENPTFDSIPECLSFIIKKICEIEGKISNQVHVDSPEEFMDLKAAAKLLHLSCSRLYTLCQQRMVPYVKIGKKLLFKREDLISYLNKGKKRTQAEIISDSINQVSSLKRKEHGN